MHFFTGLLFFLWYSTSLYGQINKGRKLLETANYEAALEAFENDIEKTTSKPISLYEIARIYYNKKYDNYNLDKAYLFTNRSLQEFEALSSSHKRRVQKKGISTPELSKLQQDIVRTALQYAQKENTIEELEHFVKYYTTSNQQQLEKAYQQRNFLVVEQAEKSNKFAQYKIAWEQYRQNMARYNPEEIQKIERYLLESYVEEKGWAMYPRFEELYPENTYVLSKDAAYDYLKIRKQSNLAVFQDFMEAYPKSPFTKFAKDKMLELTIKGANLEDYDSYVRAYPKQKGIDQLWQRFYDLYAPQKQSSTILTFIEAYPNFPFQEQIKKDLKQAQLQLERPLFLQIMTQKEVHLAISFVQQFPNSTYIPQLEQAFYEALQKKPLLRASKYFLTRYPNSVHYDAVLELYYKEYIKDGELGTLNQFMMEHPEYKNLAQQEKDLKVAEQGAKLDLSKMPTNATKPLYEAYILAAAPKERALVALQRLLEPSIHQKRWTKAQAILAQFEDAFKEDPSKIQQLKRLLVAPSPYQLRTPISSDNSSSESVVSIQEQQLIFAQEGALYQTTKKDKQWSAPILLPLINEGIQGEHWTASPDRKELVYSKKGDLYYRYLKEGQWSTPVALPDDVNGKEQELDVQLAVNGSVLLYSSESNRVLDWKTAVVAKNFHGTERSNSDLFVVVKNEQGVWQKAINLGDQINSPFAERYPFLHPDGKTLYFSSEGHGSLGGLDIYYTQRLDDTWQNWSEPVNMGTAINSAEDEGPSAMSQNNKDFYFSRQEETGSKIYYYDNMFSK
ncbi:MAG: hypothetical protein ACRBFS_17380 [Aureispira sp.]